MSETQPKSNFMLRWVAPIAAGLFVLLFVLLGFWQLDRAAQKNAAVAAVGGVTRFPLMHDPDEVERLQSVSVTGHYLADKQVVIPNIVKNDRFGYYVVTPFQANQFSGLLAVNRGWVPMLARGRQLPDVAVGDAERTLRGTIGGLPKVAIRSGPVFAGGDEWPRRGLYPELPDLAGAWQHDVAPVVLLLDANEPDGFLRQWAPPESGALTHYNYAFQWFVMAAGTLGLLVWRLNKRRKSALSS